MVSAHPNGQIFADLMTCPYCFMSEESINRYLVYLSQLVRKVQWYNLNGEY